MVHSLTDSAPRTNLKLATPKLTLYLLIIHAAMRALNKHTYLLSVIKYINQ